MPAYQEFIGSRTKARPRLLCKEIGMVVTDQSTNAYSYSYLNISSVNDFQNRRSFLENKAWSSNYNLKAAIRRSFEAKRA